MHVGNDGMSVYSKLCLKRGELAAAKQERTKHTLKTTRILLRSDFQPTIVSLSFLA